MTDPQLKTDSIIVRLAQSPQEVEAAQRLRYIVFYEEYAATPSEEMARERRDMDGYDPVTDHLIVLDTKLPEGAQIVGTYRLLRREVAEKYGKFYTSDEYNIQPLLNSGEGLLELGRSCVLPPYRTRPVLQKLWEGIANYVADHKIGLMFGCASLHGTDPRVHAQSLAYLYHYHLAPPELCPRALDSRHVEMNTVAKEDLDVRATFNELPPLIKGYLRLGCMIGDGAVVDHQFNTTDVCIVMPTQLVSDKYVRHFERVLNKQMRTQAEAAEPLETLLRGTA